MSEIKQELEAEVRMLARNRCGYCLVPQKLLSYKLEIEHIFPRGLGSGSKKKIYGWRVGNAIWSKR